MQELPLWSTCRRCVYFSRCSTPFAPSGVCPHPNEAEPVIVHPLTIQPQASARYLSLLSTDTRAASIFHSWRRGRVPSNADYLYLRALVWESEPAPQHAPFRFLQDVLYEALRNQVVDTLAYHQDITPGQSTFPPRAQHASQLLNAGLDMAIFVSGSSVVEAYEQLAPGADWTRLLLDQVRFFLWDMLRLPHRRFCECDGQFRLEFEEEWRRLLLFSDSFFGFRVVPRFRFDALVRYSRIRQGDRDIRGQISTYLTHQATEYPQLVQLFASNFTEVAFERRLRELYCPLVESTARDVLRNLEIDPANAANTPAVADVEAQVWQAFDEARRTFLFHAPRANGRPLGRMGFVGTPQTAESRQLLEQSLQEHPILVNRVPLQVHDVGEIGFAYYIRGKLRAWVTRTYPPDRVTSEIVSERLVTDESERPQRSSASLATATHPHRAETFLGADGSEYLQRRAAALFYGVTEEQLRKWDRTGELPAQRSNQVLSAPLPPPLRAAHRLYPATDEARARVQELRARKATRSTRASQDQLTRTLVAKHLGVPASTLVMWEQKGLLQPERRGNSVLYSRAQIEEAGRLEAERRRST